MKIINSKLITIKNIRQSGIYMIINLANNKFYIGSSNDIYNRKLAHIRNLKKNKHDNTHLQNSFNKYGIDYFIWVIVELLEDNHDLLIREQYWIDSFDACYSDIGYNMCPVAGTVLGRKHSQETKDKIGDIHRGKKKSKEHIEKMIAYKSKPIIQCSSTGKFIVEWESAMVASKVLDITQVPISNCCLHKIRYYKDCLWFFKEEYYSNDFDIINFIPKYAKPILQYDLNNNFIARYNGFRDVKNFFDKKINTTHILECCDGARMTSYNYIWKFENAS